MALELVTPAPSYAASLLADVKTHARLDGNGEDSYLALLIDATMSDIEAYTGRAFGVQTWRLWLDEWSDAIELPRAPVQLVSSVKYRNTSGSLITLDPAYYTLDDVSTRQWVVRNSAYNWPDLMDMVNAVQVEFIAGESALPAPVKMAVLDWVQSRYDNRSPVAMPDSVMWSLAPYRRIVV